MSEEIERGLTLGELAKKAVIEFLGSRPLPSEIMEQIRFHGGLVGEQYIFQIGLPPKRDGKPPQLIVGTVVMSMEGQVISVVITPEGEAKRVKL